MATTQAYNVGSKCPDPMTRAALLALRNAGELKRGCTYVISDYNQGTVGPAEIQLEAISENQLTLDAEVLTGFDTTAWTGRYDIDSDRLTHLSDVFNNIVSGENTILAFPWGQSNVYENVIFESTLNYVSGALYDNKIYHSTVNLNGGTLARTVVEGASTVDVSGTASLSDSSITARSSITVSAGTHYRNTIDNNSVVTQAGTGVLRFTEVAVNSNVTIGDTPINNCDFTITSINTTGSTGPITSSSFQSFTGTALQNCPNLYIVSSEFTLGSSVSVTGSAQFRSYRSVLTSSGRFLASAGAELRCDNSTVSDSGYVQSLKGFLTVTNSKVSTSYIRNADGINSVTQSEVSAQSSIRFEGTSTGCRVYYSKACTGGAIYCTNATNCYFYYNFADSVGQIYVNDRTNARMYYIHCDSYSYVRSYGTAGAGQSTMYYIKASARGYVEHIDIDARIRFYGISALSQSIIRQTAGTVDSNLYYCSAMSYFYMLLSLAGGTRFALHGTGRESYSGTPATNGTSTRNW